MNAIFERRSVRTFLDKIVEEEKIKTLLKAAMQAPSAGNQQPWEFIVVQNRKSLAEISEYNPYASCLAKASLGIVILGNREKMMYPQNWEQDLGAASQNLMLQAVELGLGSVWLGTAGEESREKFLQNYFRLPAHLVPYSVIALGYPAKEGANHFVDRFKEERVHYESY